MDSRMKITVKLFAVLKIGRFREKELVYPVGTNVGDVVNDLDLPAEHVDILLVNGRHVDREYLLQDGDILSILPMVEGG
jgi:molybdopterin converting factor small subunit